MKNIKKTKINKYLFIFIICLCLFSYKIISNLSSKKYIDNYLKNNYNGYETEFIATEKCYSNGGVWFPHKIYNCKMTTYIIKNNYEQFKLIIINNKSYKYYTRGLFAYSLKNEICKKNVSCTDGNICADTGDFIGKTSFSEGCVTVIKKY